MPVLAGSRLADPKHGRYVRSQRLERKRGEDEWRSGGEEERASQADDTRGTLSSNDGVLSSSCHLVHSVSVRCYFKEAWMMCLAPGVYSGSFMSHTMLLSVFLHVRSRYFFFFSLHTTSEFFYFYLKISKKEKTIFYLYFYILYVFS